MHAYVCVCVCMRTAAFLLFFVVVIFEVLHYPWLEIQVALPG